MAERQTTKIQKAALALIQSGPLSFTDLVIQVLRRIGHGDAQEVRRVLAEWIMRSEMVTLAGKNVKEDIHVQAAEEKTSNKRESAMSKVADNPRKLSVDEFVYLAIIRLRMGDYKAIHTVYSGFNAAFREYFAEEGFDPIEEVNRMVEEAKLIRRPVKGGVLISNDPNFQGTSTVAAALKKMGV